MDDAIVVVENVKRQIDSGKSPLEAAKVAMTEVTGPIIATTAVLMAVFVPVAFLPGITGQLYRQFALTIAISVAFSAFNSLTLSPALCAILLKPSSGEQAWAFRKFNAGFGWLSNRFASSVRTTARYWPVMFLLLGCTAGGAYLLTRAIPTAFVPVEDQGYFFVVMQLPDGAALARTEEVARQVRAMVMKRPEVQDMVVVTGLNFLTNSAQSNSAVAFAILKPWAQRAGASHTAQSIVTALKPRVAGPARQHRAQLRPAVDPGPRHHRRVPVRGRGSHRRRLRQARCRHEGHAGGSTQAARA